MTEANPFDRVPFRHLDAFGVRQPVRE